jgi:hypothetical protein
MKLCAHLQRAAVLCDLDDIGCTLGKLSREQWPHTNNHFDVIICLRLLLLLLLLECLQQHTQPVVLAAVVSTSVVHDALSSMLTACTGVVVLDASKCEIWSLITLL